VREITARLRAKAIDDPVLDYATALLAKQRGGDGELRAAFERSRERAIERNDEATAYFSEVQLVEHDLARGRPVEAALIADLLRRARTRSPMDGALAAIRAGWYEVVAGRFDAALAAIASVPDDGSSLAAFNLAPLRAYVHSALGEFEAVTSIVNALLERLSNGETIVLYASGLIWASRFALLRGDTNEAYDYAIEARRVGEPFGLRHEHAALSVALAEAAVHAGDPVLAAEAARAARRSARDAWYVRDAERAAFFCGLYEARAAFLAGDIERARSLAADRAREAPTPLFGALARAEEAVFAAVLGSRIDRHVHAALIQELAALAPGDASDAIALETATDLLAFFIALEGEREPEPIAWTHAFAPLVERRRASGRLAPAGAALHGLRTGRTSASAAAALLAGLASRGPRYELAVALATARPFAGRLRPALAAPLAAFRGAVFIEGFTQAGAPARGELVEALTGRESEILALLALGLTNKEIAQRLNLGNRTVETHVARVLGKLGVNTRARAVARALEWGLAAAAVP
jgi:DNA-binding CsgD family transcriptional regulator